MQKKKLYVVLSVPFLMLLWKKKKKKERRGEAKSVSYLPPVLFCFSLFGFGLATATLLRYYIAYSLSVPLSRISV